MMPPLEGLSVFELLYPVLSSNNLLLAYQMQGITVSNARWIDEKGDSNEA